MKGTNKAIGGGGFHHVTIQVNNFDKSIAMYKQLGFIEHTRWGVNDDKYILLDTGDGNYLEITNGGKGACKGVIIHCALRTDDCKKAFELALSVGFTTVIEPMEIELPSDPPMPVTFAFVAGLDGEEIEFFQQR